MEITGSQTGYAFQCGIFVKLRNKSISYTVRMGFGKFRKVIETENAICQDLERFGKERIFKRAMEKLWIFAWKNSKNILKWM